MPHYVKPTIDGDWIGMEFTCTEPEGSLCRLTCPPEHRCESYNMEMIDGEPWHVGFGSVFEFGSESPLHKMIPTKSCTILEWDDLRECYGGPATTLREGEIAFRWNSDYYEWEYAEPKPDKRHEITVVLNDAEMDVADFIAMRRERMRDEMTRQVGKVRNVRWTIRMEAEEA